MAKNLTINELFNFVEGSSITGESAYEIWKSLNPNGKESEFLEFLRTGDSFEYEDFTEEQLKGLMPPVIDSLESDSTTEALSAKKGKELKDNLQEWAFTGSTEGITKYPTKAGIYRITGADLGFPFDNSHFGTLIITFSGYINHIFIDSSSKKIWYSVGADNLVCPTTWNELVVNKNQGKCELIIQRTGFTEWASFTVPDISKYRYFIVRLCYGGNYTFGTHIVPYTQPENSNFGIWTPNSITTTINGTLFEISAQAFNNTTMSLYANKNDVVVEVLGII